MHNITSKKQHVQQKGIQFDGVLKAGYELAYNYASNPFQVSTLQDENYRTEGNTANDLTRKNHAYRYDANGNLIYVNTERPKKDGTQTPKSTERKLLWDEENRLEAIDDNGFVSNYWYDAAGERTVKTSGESQQMYVNSVFSGGDTQTANFTAYVNPYLVVSKGGSYTKHIYIGSQRIVSKLGDLDSYGSDPRRIEYAGANVDGAKVDYADKYKALQQTIKDNYAKFEVPYYGKDNDDYVNGQGFCCDDSKTLKSFAANANDNPELFQYYYHSDHLGSSSLITNLDGEIVQHVEYVPYGEVFIEERNNTWNTPYLFNAKELDEETGLYYYGARYYDPRTSVWLSVDAPLINGYYLDGNHNGGVYNAFNLNPYLYCKANPIIFVDPDGNQVKVVTYGQKIVSKVNDDDFVRRCATACAEKLGVTPQSFSTGKELVNILSSSSKIATYVNWGHSEPIGLYLQNNQGFYVGSYTRGKESSNIEELKKSGMKTTKSCLFIFASCNTAGDFSKYKNTSFAEQFSNAVDLSDATPGVYKVTVIGATNFSNLKLDGTVRTDGSFLQIEETFYVTPLNIFALPGKSKNAVLPMERKITDLGSHIDPAKIIKNFDYTDVSISE